MPSGPRPNPPNRGAKLVFHGIYTDTVWTNVMWLYLTGSGEITVSDLNSLAGTCAGLYHTHLMPQVSSSVLMQSCQIVLYGSGGDVIEGVATVGHAGSKNETDLPANVAACISWNIAPHYRGGHPRTYLTGLTAQERSTPSTWTGSFLTALSSGANALHTALEAISPPGSGITAVEHGVFSFVRANAWRTPPVFYRIASASVDSRIDTQRRRLGRDR